MLDLNQGIYVHFLRRRGDNSTIRYWLLARRGPWDDVPEDSDKNKFQPSARAECASRTKTTNLHHHQEGSSGGQGWRSGESTRLPPMWPGFKSRRRRHMWVELLLVLSLATRGFSLVTPFFPSPQKPTLPNSNSIWNALTRLNEFMNS